MSILTDMTRDGDRLFRWRSYLPMLLVPVFFVFMKEQALRKGQLVPRENGSGE